jgi:shikimate kinase
MKKGPWTVTMRRTDHVILRKTVVLVGMMGSGKTAIGRALAMRLDAPFVDSDAALEQAATLSIAEIFARDGEAFFRDREAEVIGRLLTGPPAILSTGGGAFLSARTRAVIAQNAVSVWLDVGLDTLWARVRNKDTRPLLRTADPLATLTDLTRVRTPVYALAAQKVTVPANTSIEETTQLVVDALSRDPATLDIKP